MNSFIDLMDKCPECHAPIGFTDKGTVRFDSSQFHMDAVKKLSQISMWKGYAQDLESAMQEFVDRCERGEVQSKYTYKKFKDLLSDEHNNQN